MTAEVGLFQRFDNSYQDHGDVFLQAVEDLLSDWSSCDFEALGILRFTELWRQQGMAVDIDTWEDYEDNKLMEVFNGLFHRNKKRVNALIKRQRILIEEEELTDENDKEFREIWPRIDRVVKVCAKAIDRICERTLKESIIHFDF